MGKGQTLVELSKGNQIQQILVILAMVNPKYSRSIQGGAFSWPRKLPPLQRKVTTNVFVVSLKTGFVQLRKTTSEVSRTYLSAHCLGRLVLPLMRTRVYPLVPRRGGLCRGKGPWKTWAPPPSPQDNVFTIPVQAKTKNDANNKSTRRKSLLNTSSSSEEVPGTGSTGKPFHPCSRCYPCEKKIHKFGGNFVVCFE